MALHCLKTGLKHQKWLCKADFCILLLNLASLTKKMNKDLLTKKMNKDFAKEFALKWEKFYVFINGINNKTASVLNNKISWYLCPSKLGLWERLTDAIHVQAIEWYFSNCNFFFFFGCVFSPTPPPWSPSQIFNDQLRTPMFWIWDVVVPCAPQLDACCICTYPLILGFFCF